MSDSISQTKKWMATAIPEPKSKNQHTQLGVHFEEVSELIQQLEPHDSQTSALLMDAFYALERLANHLKQSDFVVSLRDRPAVLDSICDQIVTGVGIAHNYGMDVEGGMQEVNRSNFSKFEAGKPVFNENLKIIKGRFYTKADFKPFV